MEQTLFYNVCGYVASAGLILGFLPQAIRTMRTRSTDDISLPAFLFMAIGASCFVLQGALHKPDILWALLITNLVTSVCSFVIFGIKIYNDFIKKR